MKNILLIIAMLVSFAANAQVVKVSLQASGLTCSMCSNSINRSLKTLQFVEDVDPNVQTSTFEIAFKPGSKVDFNAIKKKVEDAGFFVASFVASINFNNTELRPNEPVTIDDKTFNFLNTKQQVLNGVKKVKLLDKGFVSNKEYKKYAAAIPSGGKDVYSATM